MELLDTIEHLIGDEEMDITEFYKIFEAGIMEIEVGTIPRNVDRVVVGDIERTRLNEVKILFFAGVNDGNIPKTSDSRGILSNSDREIIALKNYDLSPTDQTKMYTQRLYLYMNLCKPTDKLFISYTTTGSDGKGMKPSYLINTLRNIFPSLNIVVSDNRLSLERIVNIKDSYRFFANLANRYSESNLSNDEKKLAECLLKLYRDDASDDLGKKITNAAFTEYAATKISREIVKMVYGATIQASISRMEQYANCAYAHFLKYGMELKEKTDSNFNAIDLGIVYHAILDSFQSKLVNNNLDFSTFTKDEGKKYLKEAVEEFCNDYEQGLLRDDEETQYVITKITKIMERTIDTMQFQIKRGSFLPKLHEYQFIRTIPLADGDMMLKGRIDRVDLYEDNDKVYVRIVDYKSSARYLDVTNIYHGLEQQLPLYMAEAVHHEKRKNPGKEIIPAACFYYKIDDPIVEMAANSSEQAIELELRKQLKFDGILSDSEDAIKAQDENAAGDAAVLPISFTSKGIRKTEKAVATEEIRNMLNYTEKLTKSIGDRINEGDIAINPIRVDDNKYACKFCNYKSICRFDKKIPGFIERNTKGVTPEEAKTRVMGGKEDGLYLFD